MNGGTHRKETQMIVWLMQDSVRQYKVADRQTFFAKQWDVTEEQANKMFNFEKKWQEYQEWLKGVDEQQQTRSKTNEPVELPQCLAVESGASPSKKDTAAPSKSGSTREPRKRVTAAITSRHGRG